MPNKISLNIKTKDNRSMNQYVSDYKQSRLVTDKGCLKNINTQRYELLHNTIHTNDQKQTRSMKINHLFDLSDIQDQIYDNEEVKYKWSNKDISSRYELILIISYCKNHQF